MKKTLWLWTLSAATLLTACTNKHPLDNPSHGAITVAADESFRPLVEELTKTYKGIYPETNFTLIFKPEREAIHLMVNDKARIVFASRKLEPAEQQVLRKKEIPGTAVKIATDGVALIINRANTDSLITMAELRSVFSQQVKTWAQLRGGSQTGPITLVFDNANSSNFDFMLRTFGVKDLAGLRVFAANGNRAVIDYVRKNPTALGFIGVNWISDGDAPLSTELSRDLRVMGVADKATPTRADYFQPFQRSLGLKDYPLRRDVYVLGNETHAGLGGGLVNYVIRDAGSLLVEKLGLWPAVPYNREVYLKNSESF